VLADPIPGQLYRFTFQYLWFEAAWESTLRTAGGDIKNQTNGEGTPGFPSVSFTYLATTSDPFVVPFDFLVAQQLSGGVVDASVANGANPGLGLGLPNFFLSVVNDTLTGGTFDRSGSLILIGLDDSGAGEDADHDDWVGLVRVTPVPEPASVALLGGGLIAVMARLRRRLRTRTASGRRKLEGRQTRA
jgi:hypothetical protein